MTSNNDLKSKNAMSIILLLTAIFFAMSCRECPTESENNIDLIVKDIFCTSVVLKISLPYSGAVNTFALDRNDSTVATYTCSEDDTLIIDEGLTPATKYLYSVRFLKDGKTKSESDPVAVHTMNITSHDISYWDIDTLGISGGIYDLWIVSEDNIWAVGQIIAEDPDSSFDGSGEEWFNAAHWDGEKWNLIRILNTATLYSIWYFSESDIWVSSGFPKHWDGQQWTMYHFQDMGLGIEVSTEHIWASSPNNVYFVGWKGSIVHYNGSNFTKMESGTTCKLEDVWGIDGNHIWAVGTESDNSRSVILFYNGKTWNTLHDTNNERKCWSNSVWTDNPYLLFLNGGSGRYLFDLMQEKLSKYESAGRWFGYDIYGTAYNDIFASTAGSEMLHYNGSTWYLYPEVKAQFEDYFRIRAVKANDEIVVASGYYYTGIGGLPIIIRGYR
ncbi:MAG TPA: hypothetical protein PLS75_04285 [Candidatus Marinimicrobia bacterium]|nr:hypothetical protein [Candidatus Neomarinimicrobiota bacterium]HPI27678.1 hypothetical protein [Candidatus Neomarinimicrobiota bacterium]HQO74412.1 hypothetical protein [Candidatus Neomarinimicrobiota bacterium]HQQ85341.1 hypothetical protein [Candidatus Neomarinimicrobiota bacterium]